MRDINIVVSTGRIASEPELRYTATGYPIMNFALAFNKSKKQQDGSYADEGHFIDCTVLGRRAESLAEMLQKGTAVTIQGELEQQRWEKDGQKRSKIAIVVNELKFNQPRQNQDAQQGAPYVDTSVYDEKIPF